MTGPQVADHRGLPDRALAERAVRAGLARYFAARRARVDGFVDRHFALRGALAIHRAALGWDMLRAPANLTLAAPQLGLRLAGGAVRRLGAPRLGARLAGAHLLLRTAVAREIDWLIRTDLLELPARDGPRAATRDALAEAILADPALAAALQPVLVEIGRRGDDAAFRARLGQAMAVYAGSRAAAAELTTGLASLGAGALAFNKLTPGLVTLGPTLAALWAQQAAVASFPLGAALGGVWYGLFPATPSPGLVTGMTGGLLLAGSTLAAFAGVVADPLQRRLGLHRARLLRLIVSLERQANDPAAPGFAVRDHYVARLLDLFDLLAVAWRIAHA
ncbi:MAG: hypothetical protein M0Z28_10135 [Rhodospirillales bacterium]|nr:hypothetical protein [Rhodospirillales bacterium]